MNKTEFNFNTEMLHQEIFDKEKSKMSYKEAIRKVEEFGLFHAIGDLPNSSKTVEAFNVVLYASKKTDTKET